MARFPNALAPFRKQAETLLSKGCVKDIEFSGATYQIQVVDNKDNEAWAFLQLDPQGNIKDSFCSCETDDELSNSCVHIAAAYLTIFNGNSTPLHERFENSLWNCIGELFADQLGTSSEILKKIENPKKYSEYVCESDDHQQLFTITVRTKKGEKELEQLLQQRHKETEETSLKFSNLSQEEIALWRQGRPNAHLRYELSFWNDFAKWLMLLQDGKVPYKLSYGYSKEAVPNQITIKFPDIEITYSLTPENLSVLIPSLKTVESPLRVHSNYGESISEITFDQKTNTLHIIPVDKNTKQKTTHTHPSSSIDLGKWILVPNDGFYSKEAHSLLDTPLIRGKMIDNALQDHLLELQDLLQNSKIDSDLHKITYTLNFDQDWNLHIYSYLKKAGDLTKPFSHLYKHWAYLQDDGFYKVNDHYFEQAELTIESQDVNDFVTKNRSWLNTQQEFHTHPISIENKLTYSIDQYDRLKFETQIDLSEKSEEHSDFGNWIYIKGQGFFSKISSSSALHLQTGETIDEEAVPLFIKAHRDELLQVPQFFSSKNPIVRSGLKVVLTDDNTILIAPEYELLPEYAHLELKHFGIFVYSPGEGFYELTETLPDHYLHPIEIESQDADYFFENELSLVKRYALTFDKRLSTPEKLELIADSIKEEEKLGKGWDLMQMHYQSELGAVTAAEIWKGIDDHQHFLITAAGLLDLQDDRFAWLKHLNKNRIDVEKNQMILSTMEILRLDAYDQITVIETDTAQSKHTREILRELKEFSVPEKPDLKGLVSQLRPYQEVGVGWLWFLYHHGLSGLLCDDMGLGKTHQAMALLAAVNNLRQKEGQKKKSHFLVVCPTSVIFHWQEKLQRYLPDARICTFHGIKRSLGDFHKDYDILLTSYGIWRNDNAMLNKVEFEVAIFDEIQVAKNYSSQVYSSLLKVRSKIRIGLTGTPIENRLRELKALFDIVLPHYMPEEAEYREFFVKPIEKVGNTKRSRLLTRFIKPFVLRRKKESVLQDLPEKTEEISHCVLMPHQKSLYQQVLHQSRERILRELADDKNPIPYMHIFALLSALKQICNHPAAYLKQPEDFHKFQSGKWELFVELLSEARESQQKVVVFSHYLNMLDIFQLYLNEHKIGFATIRGSTIHRGEEVRKFNEDPRCEVFVGSLHAAGLGIDLTAGSVVIHYDRWWNAARENQATDRVHRIGQTRGVQVFKLVTKGTFEERIDRIIAQKGKLMEEIVGEDDQKVLKQLNRDDIVQLLRDVDTTKDEELQ